MISPRSQSVRIHTGTGSRRSPIPSSVPTRTGSQRGVTTGSRFCSGTPTERGISVDSVNVSFLCSQAKAAPKHRKSATPLRFVTLFLRSSMVPCDSVRFFTPTIDIEPVFNSSSKMPVRVRKFLMRACSVLPAVSVFFVGVYRRQNGGVWPPGTRRRGAENFSTPANLLTYARSLASRAESSSCISAGT